jgi:hypothetical protein
MKTLNLYLITILAVLLLSSCARKAEEAAEYNDHIVEHQLEIIQSFDRFDSVFVDSVATKDQIEFVYVNMQSTIKSSILALDSIGPFQKDPLLEVAARDLFKAYDQVVSNEYRQLTEIKLLPAESITIAIVDSSFSIQMRIHDVSKMAQEKFLMAQDSFGKKYNLLFEE